mmetsp:Transcript_3321/g.20694  ORF Transcript_3321/g.20694 Transcript_3321/m.20694 type:complete len:240 (+) Transcript_3321:1108-1827(+)
MACCRFSFHTAGLFSSPNARGPMSKNKSAPSRRASCMISSKRDASSSSNANPFKYTARVSAKAWRTRRGTSLLPPSKGHGPKSYAEQNLWLPHPSTKTKQTKVGWWKPTSSMLSIVDTSMATCWKRTPSSCNTSFRKQPCASEPTQPTAQPCMPIRALAMRKLAFPPTSHWDVEGGSVVKRASVSGLASGSSSTRTSTSTHRLLIATTSCERRTHRRGGVHVRQGRARGTRIFAIRTQW